MLSCIARSLPLVGSHRLAHTMPFTVQLCTSRTRPLCRSSTLAQPKSAASTPQQASCRQPRFEAAALGVLASIAASSCCPGGWLCCCCCQPSFLGLWQHCLLTRPANATLSALQWRRAPPRREQEVLPAALARSWTAWSAAGTRRCSELHAFAELNVSARKPGKHVAALFAFQ